MMKKNLIAKSVVFFLIGIGVTSPTIEAIAQPSPDVHQNLISQTNQPSNTSNIILLNPGAEPREELRFKPQPLTKQTLKISAQTNITMTMGSQKVPKTDLPITEMTVEMEVTKVDENTGDIYINFLYKDAQVIPKNNTPAQLTEAMRSQVQQLIGLNGSLIIDNRGASKGFQVNFPDNLEAKTKQTLNSLVNSLKEISAPFPQEALGVGAQWQVNSSLQADGINLTQITSFNLISLQDNIATLEVSIEQKAPAQTINYSGMPAGTTVNLVSLNTKGNGRMIINLEKIAPLSGGIQATSDTKMNILQGSEQQIMESQSTIETNFKSE